MPVTPVNATVVTSQSSITVSAAAGGAGDIVANSTDTLFVVLRNIGSEDCEYRVDAGAWTRLGFRSSVQLDINLSVNVIRVRKVANANNASLALDTHTLSGSFSVGDDALDTNRMPVVEKTASYTLALTDAGGQVDMNVAGANTCTVPPNSTVPFPTGTVVIVCMKGAGITTIAAGAGVTLQKPVAKSLAISAQYETARLHKVATDTWRVNAT